MTATSAEPEVVLPPAPKHLSKEARTSSQDKRRIGPRVFRLGQETNRRRHGRFPISGLQLATAGFEGSVLDLGRIGMRIETSTSLPIGQSCSVRLRYRSEEATIAE